MTFLNQISDFSSDKEKDKNHKVRCLFAQGITSLTVYRFKQYTAPATTISTATSGSGGTISGSQSAATVVKVTRGAYS